MILALIAVTALAVGLFMSRLLRRPAIRWGFVDQPADHKAHSQATPYLGGVAIACGVLVSVPWVVGDVRTQAILLGAVAFAALGLADDIRPLPPIVRLGVETVIAFAVVLAGVQIPLTGTVLDAPLTVCWVVLIVNSVNLLDNADGALGGVAVVTAAGLAAAAMLSGQMAIAILLIALSASCLGFLEQNRPPAKIFMGDSGSLFIGSVIALSSVAVHPRATAIVGMLLPVFVAVVDTGVVVVARYRGRRPILQGGTDHVAHRLMRSRLSPGRTSIVLAAAAGAGCLADLAVLSGAGTVPVVAGIALAGALILVIAFQRLPAPSRPLTTMRS